MDLPAIQAALRDRNIDGWLFYDHHHRDPIAYRVLGLPATLMATRRWFYLIPAQGEPVKLVHKIEAGHLDSLPGQKREYASWQELFECVKVMLKDHRDIAMQYSPNNLIFYVSLVDAGTVELIRGLGKNVVSSGDLVAQFEATLTEDQIKSHFAARDAIDAITAAAFQEIGHRARNGGTTEYAIQQWFMEAFGRENLITDDPPIVASTPIAATRITSRVPQVQLRFAKAILYCWMFGQRRISPTPSTTTSPGPVSSATRPRNACAKSLKSSVMPAMPASRRCRMPSPLSVPSPAGRWTAPFAITLECRLWPVFHSSHRPLHRHGNSCQRRQHGRS